MGISSDELFSTTSDHDFILRTRNLNSNVKTFVTLSNLSKIFSFRQDVSSAFSTLMVLIEQ